MTEPNRKVFFLFADGAIQAILRDQFRRLPIGCPERGWAGYADQFPKIIIWCNQWREPGGMEALHTDELPRQCAWCGLILTGPWQGATALCLAGTESHPYLLPGYSHGLCQSCRKKMRTAWLQFRVNKDPMYSKSSLQRPDTYARALASSERQIVLEAEA